MTFFNDEIEVASYLGRLVMSFNDLEVAIGGALMRVLLKEDDEYVGAVFVANLNFSQRFAVMRALTIEPPKIREEFELLLNQAKDINGRRNNYLHAEYSPILTDDYTPNQPVTFLHQRLRDYSKESSTDTMKEIFKYIRPPKSRGARRPREGCRVTSARDDARLAALRPLSVEHNRILPPYNRRQFKVSSDWTDLRRATS
jgi:hypothetical protein